MVELSWLLFLGGIAFEQAFQKYVLHFQHIREKKKFVLMNVNLLSYFSEI